MIRRLKSTEPKRKRLRKRQNQSRRWSLQTIKRSHSSKPREKVDTKSTTSVYRKAMWSKSNTTGCGLSDEEGL